MESGPPPPLVMNRTLALLVALIVAVGMVGMAVPMAVADEADDANDAAEVEPGEQLAGVLGVQDAELEGELDDRTFGIQVANAATEDEAADVVADRLDDVEADLEDLEDRHADLEDAREAGEISEGQYQAETAEIAAEKGNLERAANDSGAVAAELPEDVLAEHGIDVEAIETLQTEASELGGEQVSEIAQSIAGDHVGQSMAEDPEDRIPDHPGTDGPPADEESDEESDDEAGADDTPADDAGADY